MRTCSLLLLLAGAVPTIAGAQSPTLVVASASAAPGGALVAKVVLLAPVGDGASLPDRLAATLHAGGRAIVVTLDRQGGAAGAAAPGGWIAADYAAPRPDGITGAATLAVADAAGATAFELPPEPAPARLARAADALRPAPLAAPERTASAAPAPARDNPVLANLSAYRPIYAVFGASHTTAGRVQFSLQYQLFGDAAAPTGRWLEGLRFGYTQRMLWDVGRYSSPFHDVSYMPELFYAVDGATTAGGVHFAGQAGIRHESNGRGGEFSRGYQVVYVQPTVAVPVGRYTLEAAPQLTHYVFGRDRNADLPRYRGHQSLHLSIGTPDGFKLATDARFNFGTGRGAAEAELSYPLWKVLGSPVYMVAEGFTGYGESLLDYDRRGSRVRIGLGLVR